MARPIPLLLAAPVTKATLPLRTPMSYLLNCLVEYMNIITVRRLDIKEQKITKRQVTNHKQISIFKY